MPVVRDDQGAVGLDDGNSERFPKSFLPFRGYALLFSTHAFIRCRISCKYESISPRRSSVVASLLSQRRPLVFSSAGVSLDGSLVLDWTRDGAFITLVMVRA